MWWWFLLVGCGGDRTVTVGGFEVTLHRSDGTLAIANPAHGLLQDDVALLAGTGSAEVTMQFGAFRFDDVRLDLTRPAALDAPRGRFGATIVEVRDAQGDDLGLLTLSGDADRLVLQWAGTAPGTNRVALEGACAGDDHFLGLGSHAFDTDHVGEAFAVWVSEPGIGKSDTDAEPPGWPLAGSRHATSYAVPWVLRPEAHHGVLVDTSTRVDVDLCATDPDRYRLTAWEGATSFVFVAGEEPLDVVRSLTDLTGRPELPAPWVFAPWNDAVRGPERVRAVAAALRGAGAPSSVIWSEDWKGAEQTNVGYHLSGEWALDPDKYPDAPALAAELEADGFRWFAYFSPFVRSGTAAWDQAVEADVLLRDDDGAPYTFSGVTFEPESMLDLSTESGRAWAQERMAAALEIGFDGWMADYAEWLPPDARLASGEDALSAHHRYPEWWQGTNRDALAGHDATFFVRSGWTRSAGLAPVVWAGDQRTSFDADDGLPTVLPLGLGLSACGVGVFTHDVAGYQSVGNPPSDRELWFRWASLGAFSPVLRTHHGAFDTDNHQFDTDPETLAHWATVATWHTALWPYRYGLAARAADEGVPMLLPLAFLHDAAWDRTDAWMLGDALLVAPVVEAGATGRHVDLPGDVAWFDWWTGAPAASGFHAADVGQIPVFAAAGTTVPLFAEVPDTLVPTDAPGLSDLDDVDGARVVLLFDGGGPFTEADGTRYRPSGTPTGDGASTATLTSGTVEVAGVTLRIDGPRERTYTVRVLAR